MRERIDALRARAREALEKRDPEAWKDLLWPDLRYRQPDGRWVGLEELVAGLRRQFDTFESVETSSEILELRAMPWGARTRIQQEIRMAAPVFFFWKVVWDVRRTSWQDWEERNGELRVREVRVMQEEVRRNGRLVDPYRRRFLGGARDEERRAREFEDWWDTLREQGYRLDQATSLGRVWMAGLLPNGLEFEFQCQREACELEIYEPPADGPPLWSGDWGCLDSRTASGLAAGEVATVFEHLLAAWQRSNAEATPPRQDPPATMRPPTASNDASG